MIHMNVPDDPRGVLGLIQEVERAVEETQCRVWREWCRYGVS